LLSLILVFSSCSASGDSAERRGGSSETTRSVREVIEAPTPAYKESITPYAQPLRAEEMRVSMSLVGNCQPGSDLGTHEEGSYNRYAENYPPDYFFGGVQSVFGTDDITIINFESVLTDNTGLSPASAAGADEDMCLGPTSNVFAYIVGNIEVAGVANDHTYDYGDEGYSDTVNALVGAGLTVGEDLKPVYYEVKGITVGILACNCLSVEDASLVRDQIAIMNEKSHLQVILPHGDSTSVDEWRDEYRSFIDAGADIVAASHGASLQPLEKYNDGVIAYSLGNFCYGGSDLPENASIILSATAVFLDGEYDRVEYEVILCYLYTTERNNYSPELISPQDPSYRCILDLMYGLGDSLTEKS